MVFHTDDFGNIWLEAIQNWYECGANIYPQNFGDIWGFRNKVFSFLLEQEQYQLLRLSQVRVNYWIILYRETNACFTMLTYFQEQAFIGISSVVPILFVYFVASSKKNNQIEILY